MESPDNENMQLHPVGESDDLELKHADNDSINSIPPPPPPVGMIVPVASEESCDITEEEKFKLHRETEKHPQEPWQQHKDSGKGKQL